MLTGMKRLMITAKLFIWCMYSLLLICYWR